MKIAVIALGKIGLPLAVQFASKGHDVVGVDVNQQVVELVNAGTEPFPGEAAPAGKTLRLVPAGKLRATTDYAEAVPGADAVVLVVPLFVDADAKPDFGWMDAATPNWRSGPDPGHPGVLRDNAARRDHPRPAGSRCCEDGSGLVEGQDFHLVFSPERVLTGRVFEDLRKYPKLVGGLVRGGAAKRASSSTNRCWTSTSVPTCRRPNGVWDLGSAEASELAKLAETTYRDVNIGLANQFARFADTAGIDIYQVIEASNSQPYSHIHRPGIAVGGHCIPVYPRLYLWKTPRRPWSGPPVRRTPQMPDYTVGPARGRLRRPGRCARGGAGRGLPRRGEGDGLLRRVRRGRGARAAGRRGTCTTRCTPTTELDALGFTPYHVGEPVDAAVVQADHAEYRTAVRADLPGVKVFIDGRRVSSADRWDGVVYRVIGKA